MSGRKEDTVVGNTVEKDAAKRQGSIATHALMKTRDFIIVVGFPGSIKGQVLAYWNLNSLCHNVSVYCCVCLPSTLYFTC